MALNRNQKHALKALLESPSVAAAARSCGLSERTLWRYLGDREFTAALDARQDKETKALTASLAGLSGAAIEALHELMTDAATPPSVRARVALGWLRERREAIELDALAQRVSALEDRIGERK